MSGIYFHIPFCKTRCSYCDFYSTTKLLHIDQLTSCLKAELWQRRNYLSDKEIQTVYFGGGTPSLLNVQQIQNLLQAVQSIYKVEPSCEITLEANPDDLTYDYLVDIKKVGVNRLSIGIQSFIDNHLHTMNRRHSAQQAIIAVENAQKAGFENISVDLIYGLPNLTEEQWIQNLEKVFSLNVQHISAYHLTYHEKTALWNSLQKGIVQELSEEESIRQFEVLKYTAERNGFCHYELSNFGLPQCFSNHNSSYWKQKEYIGIGPSAHSYNSNSRQWNVSDLKKYMEGLEQCKKIFQEEKLTINDKFNDYVITRLRTVWGIDLKYIQENFDSRYVDWLKKKSEAYLNSLLLEYRDGNICLTRKGMFVSDGIMESLIYMNDLK